MALSAIPTLIHEPTGREQQQVVPERKTRDVDGVTLLSDATGEAARRQGFEPPALVIADRFGDIWAAWEGGEHHALPDTATIADWLAFLDIQCPECTMIEWKGEP